MSDTRIAERAPNSTYSEEEIQRGLTYLAMCGGRPQVASERLAAAGHEVPESTLRHWRDKAYTARYHDIYENQASKLAQAIATEAEEVAFQAAELERKTLIKLDTAIEGDEIPAKELASTLRNLTTTKSLNIDKVASPLRGRPSRVTEGYTDPVETLRVLAQAGVLKSMPPIEGTAQELPTAGPSVIATSRDAALQRTSE